MERMTYSLEQINNSFKLYQGFCEKFLELTFDDETKDKLESILYTGKYNNFFCDSLLANAGDAFIEAKRRLAVAYLLVNNPETFDYLAENQINLFHGTNANALPSILKYGLNSGLESEKNGISVSTGESWSRIGGKQRAFVSFTDVLDIAEWYSTADAINSKEELSFQVIVGTTEKEANNIGRYRVRSSVPEIAIKNKLPLEGIKVIMVPSSKLEFVKRLVGDRNIKVLPIHPEYDKFYYVDLDSYYTYFDKDRFETLKESLRNSKIEQEKRFSLNELKTLMVRVLRKVFKENKVESEELIDGIRKR